MPEDERQRAQGRVAITARGAPLRRQPQPQHREGQRIGPGRHDWSRLRQRQKDRHVRQSVRGVPEMRRLQISDEITGGQATLMNVQQTCMGTALMQPPARDAQEVIIMRDEHPAERGGACEQIIVWEPVRAVILGGEEIDVEPTQSRGHLA